MSIHHGDIDADQPTRRQHLGRLPGARPLKFAKGDIVAPTYRLRSRCRVIVPEPDANGCVVVKLSDGRYDLIPEIQLVPGQRAITGFRPAA